ncbi:MAG: hypothetical protein IJF44_04060 [Clostridia bacterium]|nr:hypothetical protein [Clostridia bacterium]
MKNKQPQEIKYFKYKFTKLMIVLAFAVIALCLVGLGLSVYRLVQFGVPTFLDSLKSPLLIFVCVFCIAIVIGILLRSRYVVNGEYYYVQFGFIKSKYSIKEITAVILDTDTKKLTVYVWENFSVLTMQPDQTEKFVQALQAVKPSITYSVTLTDTPDETK